ncbi:MAG: hypothetical protein AAGH76_05935 [Pseudomonadota bacterium]
MNELDDERRDDELVELWRSIPAVIAASDIVTATLRQARARRQIGIALTVFWVIVIAMMGYFDLRGFFAWRGAATLLLVVTFAKWVYDQYGGYQRDQLVTNTAPNDYLEAAIRHARASLRVARMTYSVMPLGAVMGYLVAPWLVESNAKTGWPWPFRIVVISVLVASIVGLAAWGHREATIKRREIAELERRRTELEISL